MKKMTTKIAMCIALGLVAGVPMVSIAADGPNLATLVPIDENKYDLNNKKPIPEGRSDVLERISKGVYFREIFEVKEKQAVPQTAYIVRENKVVTRNVPQTDETEVYVRVNKAQVGPAWAYQNR
jgi:hypothetical protein